MPPAQTLTGPDFAFAQSHTHTDAKLVLGFLACGVALGSTGWVYAAGVGWDESKPVLRLAVGACVRAFPPEGRLPLLPRDCTLTRPTHLPSTGTRS